MAHGKFYAGQKVHSFTIVQKIPDDLKTRSPNLKRRWRVECECGSRETIPEYYLTRANPKQHCGCKNKTIKTHFNREYRIWLMMHKRCYDTTHIAYKDYGGRGIGICPEWHRNSPDGKGFDRFLAFIGPAPSEEYSVDRINNNVGYQPFQADGVTRQVRWATAKEQRANQRPSRR
jgi:hypothetical protein